VIQVAARLVPDPPRCSQAFGRHPQACRQCSQLVLATGPGDPPAVRVVTSSSVCFGSKPGPKLQPQMTWKVVTLTWCRTVGIRQDSNQTAVPTFRFLQLWLQLSIWVLIISWHDQYWDFAFQALLHCPRKALGSAWVSLSGCEIWANTDHNSRDVDGDPVNIRCIPYLSAGGESASKTAQSTYWSFHNTIRTQILNLCDNLCLQCPGFQVGPGPNSTVWGFDVGKLLDRFGSGSNPNTEPLLALLPVHLKAGKNALRGSDTLLKSTHLSLHSTSSQTLLAVSSDQNTLCWCETPQPPWWKVSRWYDQILLSITPQPARSDAPRCQYSASRRNHPPRVVVPRRI